jgi:hypothetical protein
MFTRIRVNEPRIVMKCSNVVAQLSLSLPAERR